MYLSSTLPALGKIFQVDPTILNGFGLLELHGRLRGMGRTWRLGESIVWETYFMVGLIMVLVPLDQE